MTLKCEVPNKILKNRQKQKQREQNKKKREKVVLTSVLCCDMGSYDILQQGTDVTASVRGMCTVQP